MQTHLKLGKLLEESSMDSFIMIPLLEETINFGNYAISVTKLLLKIANI